VIARLLASCDRRPAVGSRDYAVVLLLVRLSLRAQEVASLELEDPDWRAGEVVVRGKGCREERLAGFPATAWSEASPLGGRTCTTLAVM